MMNFPMPKLATDEDFARLWPQAEAFIKSVKPEFIILQCGADSMKGDPITHLQYSQQSWQLATESLCRIADEFCDGRIIALVVAVTIWIIYRLPGLRLSGQCLNE